MKNRVFRIVVCFALIISLVMGEATMTFAANANDKYKDWEVVKVELKNYSFKEGKKFTYTGKAIKPTIGKLEVNVEYKSPETGDIESVIKSINKLSSSAIAYKNNTSIGTGYMVATVEGTKLQLPFSIGLGKVKTIKATSTSNTSIKINWSKVTGASGYIVYRSSQENGGFKAIKKVTSGSTTQYTNTGLKLESVYYYKVLPYRNVNGTRVDGVYSAVAKKKARPVTPTITSVKKQSYNSLKISWKRVSDVSGYRIYRSSTASGGYERVKTIRNNETTSYIDKKNTCGKKYYYKIRTYKTVKLKRVFGAPSKAASGRTSPAKTKFNNETISWYKSVELNWNKSAGASGYVIYRSKKSGSGYTAVKTIKKGTTLKYVDRGLNGKVQYYYKVRPYVNVKGEKIYGAYSKTYKKYLVSKKLESLVKKYVGAPYRFGGNTPKGWDCSGFVQWALNYMYGKEVPRSGSAQARGGKYVNKNDMSKWKPGDVLVYKRNGGGVSHVGLYIGGGKMMHALNSRYDTIVQDVSYYESWDRGNYLAGVRRY